MKTWTARPVDAHGTSGKFRRAGFKGKADTMSEIEAKVWSEVQRAIYDSVKQRLSDSYNSPLVKVVDSVVAARSDELRTLIDQLFTSAIRDEAFKRAASEQLAHKVAKTLLSKMEGAIEKATNTFRSDPALRAKLLLAVDKIVADYQPTVAPSAAV